MIGTYTIGAANPRAPFGQMSHNAFHVITWGAALEGVGSRPFGSPGVPPLLGAAHAIGLGLGLLAIAIGLVAIVRTALGSVLGNRGLRSSDGDAESDDSEAVWFQDVLVFGFFGGCATFVWFAFSSVAPFGRYLTAAVIFGSILATVLAGQITERVRGRWPRAVLAGVAGLVVLGYAATFVNTLTTRSPTQPAAHLAVYLEQHHLTKGIGDYWSASIVTVESSGSVVVRPVVTIAGDHHVVRYTRLSSSSWYGGGFEFLVYNATASWGGVDAQAAVASFGPPQHVAAVGPYHVLTWAHDLSLQGDGAYAPQPWAHQSATRPAAARLGRRRVRHVQSLPGA